jgi:hypothetical protein
MDPLTGLDRILGVAAAATITSRAEDVEADPGLARARGRQAVNAKAPFLLPGDAFAEPVDVLLVANAAFVLGESERVGPEPGGDRETAVG